MNADLLTKWLPHSPAYIFPPRFLFYQKSIGYLMLLNIIRPSPDEGSLEPKCYSVDFLIY